MFYDRQPDKQKLGYKGILQIIGSLSKLYSDSEAPYLYYRAHENVFCKYFEAENYARKDDSADAGKDRIGVGLKTWVGSNDQKVAEFGKLRPQYSNLTGIDLIKRIAFYRNERIRTTKNFHGLDEMFYHVVKRVPNAMQLYECSFDPIDIDNIVLDESRGLDNNIYFSDGHHTYHFSLSKNTLYMIFDDLELVDSIEVEILDNPFDELKKLKTATPQQEDINREAASFAVNNIASAKNIKLQLCLRLYSVASDGTKFVPDKSGLNQWNASGRVRNPDELYISYPKKDRDRAPFFPSRDTPFELLLPDGQWISAKVCQEDGKAIMSNPNKLLGHWLLRKVFELPENTKVTYDMLEVYGIDSVIFTKLEAGKYSVDFCQLGTYEEFYGLNNESEEKEDAE